MKELSIEEKAKLYDEVVNKLKGFMAQGVDPLITRADVQDFFPELRESEDERVRTFLYHTFTAQYLAKDKLGKWHGEPVVNILAWLEKQGEQKYIPKYKIGDYVKDTNYKGEPIYEIVYMDKECYICEYRGKKRMGDKAVMHFSFDNPYLRLVQKPTDKVEPKFKIGDKIQYNKYTYTIKEVQEDCYVLDDDKVLTFNAQDEWELIEQKSTDKVEPKFKQGEWIIFNGLILYVSEVVQGYYRTISIDGIPNSYDWDIDNAARLWTIQEAKAGDVLVDVYGDIGIFEERYGTNWHTYCYLGNEGRFISEGGSHGSICYLATKEQRDALMKAMHESGYEWDADKKELKKIEQKHADNIESSAFKDKLLELFQKFRYIKEGVPTNGDIIEYVDAHIQELINTIQNNAWSEDDERSIRDSIFYLKSAKKYFEKDDDILWDEKWFNLCIEWLEALYKRLQPQPQWKPSDELVLKGYYQELLKRFLKERKEKLHHKEE